MVNKPPLLLTVPDRTGRPSLGRLLQEATGRRIYPVHRLDFGVGGLVLFAHSPRAQTLLSQALEHGRIRKTYEAITTGDFSKTEEIDLRPGALAPKLQFLGSAVPGSSAAEFLRFESCLVRGKKRSFEAPYGKQAITLARVTGTMQIGPTGTALQWDLRPLTGRPHQLRVQLAMRGYPILGDVLYGGTPRAPFENGVIALKATRLTFDFENPEIGVTRGDYSLDTRSVGDIRPSVGSAVPSF